MNSPTVTAKMHRFRSSRLSLSVHMHSRNPTLVLEFLRPHILIFSLISLKCVLPCLAFVLFFLLLFRLVFLNPVRFFYLSFFTVITDGLAKLVFRLLFQNSRFISIVLVLWLFVLVSLLVSVDFFVSFFQIYIYR